MAGRMQGASTSYCDICPVCGARVEVLNGDVRFSMNVHLQSHRTEETIIQDINKHLRISQASRPQTSNYTCPDCKENIEVLNNDVAFSLKIHAKKHKSPDLVISDDQRSVASDSSRKSDKKLKEQSKKCEDSNILEALFNTMPPGLKSHRGFLFENENGKAICTVCKITVEPKLSISEHLKTKAHEDKTICLLKEKLPVNLHENLEFISFYGSHLCCNLCRCKIDLCSTNPYETIVNIIVHNSGTDHPKRKIEMSGQIDADLVLKSLSRLNPLINVNKHMISHKVFPQFKCSVCDKNIGHHENEKELIKNFVSHFSSSAHSKCVFYREIVDSYNALYPGDKAHKFTVSKSGISCIICNCTFAEANLDKLILHSKQSLDPMKLPPASLFNPVFPSTSQESSVKKEKSVNVSTLTSLETTQKKELNLSSLLNTLPQQFKNVRYIVENGKGQVTCQICKCTIPASTYNLKTHLLGNKHKTNENKSGVTNEQKKLDINNGIPASTYNLQTDLLGNKHKINENNSGVTNDQKKLDINDGMLNQRIKDISNLLPSFMQLNTAFLEIIPNDMKQVLCSVCNCKVTVSSMNLQEHFSGSQHVSSVKKLLEKKGIQVVETVSSGEKDILFNNLVKTDKVIKSFAKFLEKKDDLHYFCKLCKITITRSNDEQLLKRNLTSHATGQKHKKCLQANLDQIYQKLKLSNTIIATNNDYLKRNDETFFCSLCGCTIPSSAEEENLEKSLMSHLTGNKHVEKRAMPLTPHSIPAIFPVDMSLNVSSKDVVMECFKRLPLSFQDDAQYIGKSSIVGYFSCKLCEGIINPRYLREHLEDENHILKKISTTTDLITF
uniref:C2H2-type domain-containing protein n=1 Tax=Cuerna arida TaxID=1464854 RepID=A0A1B6FD43_9HEMI